MILVGAILLTVVGAIALIVVSAILLTRVGAIVPDVCRCGLLAIESATLLMWMGQRPPINGQRTGSPAPVEQDILTGSNANGTVAAGLTCADWTSTSAGVAAQVGHSDGMVLNQSTTGTLSSWNSAHANQSCANTVPRGGAGRFYCFAR